MAMIAVFMIVWGERPRRSHLAQYHRRFSVPVGRGSPILPIPIGGACLLLFIIERIFLGLPSDPLLSPSRYRASSNDRVRGRPWISSSLLGTMLVCFVIGMPICLFAGDGGDRRRAFRSAFPLESLDAENLRRRQQGGDADNPVLPCLAGAIMAEGGMARAAGTHLPNVLVGFTRLRGGLSIVNVLATTFFERHFRLGGGRYVPRSGSVMIPQMEKTGYPARVSRPISPLTRFGAGRCWSPPSHKRGLVFARDPWGHDLDQARCSWPACFRASCSGYSLIILCLVVAYRESHPRGTRPYRPRTRWRITIDAAWGTDHAGHHFWAVFWAASSPPIEAGAGGLPCGAFFVTMFIYRDYRWRGPCRFFLHRDACATVGDGADLDRMPLPASATIMAADANAGKNDGVSSFRSPSNKYVILFLINILLLVLGTLVDMAPSILIATPPDFFCCR